MTSLFEITLQQDNATAVSMCIPVLACTLLTYKLFLVFKPLFARVPAYDLGENEDEGDDPGDGPIPLLDPDDTYDLLTEIGLINLLGNPTIVGLFTGYLALMGKLTFLLNLNLDLLDPGTLMTLLRNLKPIMTYNELSWHLLRSV